MKYRVEFQDKKLVSVQPTGEEMVVSNNFDEERTGILLEAIIEAGNGKEAQEKAKRLEIELQTGQTKDQLEPKKPTKHK